MVGVLVSRLRVRVLVVETDTVDELMRGHLSRLMITAHGYHSLSPLTSRFDDAPLMYIVE